MIEMCLSSRLAATYKYPSRDARRRLQHVFIARRKRIKFCSRRPHQRSEFAVYGTGLNAGQGKPQLRQSTDCHGVRNQLRPHKSASVTTFEYGKSIGAVRDDAMLEQFGALFENVRSCCALLSVVA